MRIKSVKAWWVRIPIEASRQHRSDFGQVRTFDAAILRIETDDGLVGWGEGKNAAGSAGDYGALVHMLNHEVGPQLIGRDAGDIGVIWEMLYNGVALRSRRRGRPRHAADRAARHDDRGDQRRRHRAVGHSRQVARRAGLAAARRAQAGAHAGLCLGRLGAGRHRSASSSNPISTQGGFKAVKMRVGAMDGAPHVSAARVQAAREALGPDVDLMVDAHGTYTVADAKRFIQHGRATATSPGSRSR